MKHPELSLSRRRVVKLTLTFVFLTTLAGVCYPFIFEAARTWISPVHVGINGALIGLFVGLGISGGEFYLFRGRLRRLPFLTSTLVQTLFNVVVITASFTTVTSVHGLLFRSDAVVGPLMDRIIREYFQNGRFLIVNAYALSTLFSITFVRQMNRLLGQNALWNFITGRYHTPVEEDRVFMFLDLNGSTQIAEKLGHQRFHNFLNDFFFDITPAIIDSRGEIYQYVGDEVVVTWKGKTGLRHHDCLACYFRIAAAIGKLTDAYEQKYGIVPTFKAGFHYGRVVTGVIGDLKRDMVFHGDTVNTTARIRSECTRRGRRLLFSEHLLNVLEAPVPLTVEPLGTVQLPGKSSGLALYSLLEAA